MRRKSLKSSPLKHLLMIFSHFIPAVAARREWIHPAGWDGQTWRGIRDSLLFNQACSEQTSTSDAICCTSSASPSRNSPFPQSEPSRNSHFSQLELTEGGDAVVKQHFQCSVGIQSSLHPPGTHPGGLDSSLGLVKSSFFLLSSLMCSSLDAGIHRVHSGMVFPLAYKATEDFRPQFSPSAQAKVGLKFC